MDEKQNLSDQRRKLEEVRMWLQHHTGGEADPRAREQMFQAWRLAALASIALETANHLTNYEYDDAWIERGRSVN